MTPLINCLYFSPLTRSGVLKGYLESMYANAAQYNHPPSYPVTMVCSGIDGAPSEIDILSKIFAGVVAYFGNSSCYVNGPRNISETIEGWSWQVNAVHICYRYTDL
jgi:lysosomal Pro-X carboxypeptidase